MERVKGIEPSWPAWKAGALPLCYTRLGLKQKKAVLYCLYEPGDGYPTRTRTWTVRTKT